MKNPALQSGERGFFSSRLIYPPRPIPGAVPQAAACSIPRFSILGRTAGSLFGGGAKLPAPERFRVITSRVYADGVAFLKYGRIK